MKDWKKRRMKRAAEIAHIAEDEPPNTYSDFSMGWDEGRTDALAELSFVRESIQDVLWIDKCRCDPAYTERHRHAPNTYCGELDSLRECLSRLDALTGDGVNK